MCEINNNITDNEQFSSKYAWFIKCSIYASIIVEMPEGKRLLGKPRRRWEDTTKCRLC
jgi:hypothetical protein